MKLNFKKSLLTLISITIISVFTWACADWGYDYFNYSNITPEVLVHNKYQPFFYDESNFYYKGISHSNINHTFEEVNIEEWNDFLGNKIPKEVIKELLNSENHKMLKSLEKMCKGQPLGTKDTSLSKEMVKDLKFSKFIHFIEYINLSNASNQYSLNEFSPWSDPKEVVPVNQTEIYTKLNANYNSLDATSLFLKRKYALQLMRYYYFNEPTKGPSFYTTIDHLLIADATSARIVSYLAGIYYKEKKYAQSNYYFSKAYSLNDDIKLGVNFSFHPQNESDWKQTLKLAEEANEKIVLWHLLGYYFDEERAIKEIIKIDPNSEYLDLLLVRYINRIESNTDFYKIDKNNMNLNKFQKDSIALFQTIVDNSANKTVSNPFLWNIAAGYIHWMSHDYKKADNYYINAQKLIPNNDQYKKKQWLILHTINQLTTQQEINPTLETTISSQVLSIINDTSLKEDFRTGFIIEFTKNKLIDLYKKKGDKTKLQCLISNDSFYLDNKNIDQMIQYMNQTSKPIDKLLLHYYPVNESDLIYFKGLKAIYAENYSDAKIYFSNFKKDTNYLLANPFNGFIKDCHDCEFLKPQKSPITPQGMVYKMSDIHDSIAQGKNVYLHSLLLANAYYNMSFYGNARTFFTGYCVTDYLVSPEDISFPYRKMFLSMDNASKYYTLALNNATSPEQKAKCTYMLAKCERNEYYNTSNKYFIEKPEFPNNYWDKILTVFSGKYFKQLKTEFTTTKYYQEIIKECSYFDYYTKKN